jgi:hypothetical protein
MHELLSIVVPIVPGDDQNAFLMGLIWSPSVDLIFDGIVPLYAAYRVGLISYLVDQEVQPVIEPKTRTLDILDLVTNKKPF